MTYLSAVQHSRSVELVQVVDLKLRQASLIAAAELGAFLAAQQIVLEARLAVLCERNYTINDAVLAVALRQNHFMNGALKSRQWEVALSDDALAVRGLRVDLSCVQRYVSPCECKENALVSAHLAAVHSVEADSWCSSQEAIKVPRVDLHASHGASA